MSMRDLILAAGDRPARDIFVKEWNATVNVRTLSGAERDSWETSIATLDGKVGRDNIRAKLLVRTLYDAAGEAGQRIFADEDAELLGAKSAKVLERLFDVAAKLNGIRAGDIEELEKN